MMCFAQRAALPLPSRTLVCRSVLNQTEKKAPQQETPLSKDGREGKDEIKSLIRSGSANDRTSQQKRLQKQPNNGSNGGDSPPPKELPAQLRTLLALLTEYGGVYGTAAVLIAWFTKIDGFGGMHWDQQDILLGLSLFAPVMVMDALVLLPDYASRKEETQTQLQLFIDPTILSSLQAAVSSKKSDSSENDGEATLSPSAAAAKHALAAEQASAAAADQSAGSCLEGTASSSGRDTNGSSKEIQLSWLEAGVQRTRLALHLLQGYYLRNNPTAILKPWNELLVVLVGCLTEEMLYRAVVLTLLAFWLRDRFYEAGADDILSFGSWELATSDAAKWTAVAMFGVLGLAAFGLQAWQEVTRQRSFKIMVQRGPRTDQDASSAAAGPSAAFFEDVSSSSSSSTARRWGQATVPPELLQQLQSQLSSSMMKQNLLMWGIEALREVMQVLASCTAFVLTGNLASSYVGAVVSSVLFSGYQRRAAARITQKRLEMWQEAVAEGKPSLIEANLRKRRGQQAPNAAGSEPSSNGCSTNGDNSTSSSTSSGSSSREGPASHSEPAALPDEHKHDEGDVSPRQ